MIRVEHVSKQYNGTNIVSDVDFEVHRDETLVLLGTSGSGKTTTLKMINKQPGSERIWNTEYLSIK